MRKPITTRDLMYIIAQRYAHEFVLSLDDYDNSIDAFYDVFSDGKKLITHYDIQSDFPICERIKIDIFALQLHVQALLLHDGKDNRHGKLVVQVYGDHHETCSIEQAVVKF